MNIIDRVLNLFQCELSQGTTKTQAFIEARGAVVGKFVEITEPGFDGLWRVDSVSNKSIQVTNWNSGSIFID